MENDTRPIAVFPGSFDPYTIAHNDLVLEASKFFRVHILICANPDKPSGMFTPSERKDIITSVFKCCYPISVEIVVWPGLVTDYCKENHIEYVIRGIQYKNAAEELDLSHIYYDDANLKTVFFPTYDVTHEHISSTRIREYIKKYNQLWEYFVPTHAVNTMRLFIENKREHERNI